jgi:hypothetical protein
MTVDRSGGTLAVTILMPLKVYLLSFRVVGID